MRRARTWRRRTTPLATLLAMVVAAWARADEPPTMQHQPVPCTLPEKWSVLCASITDDVGVSRARLYFRPSGDKYYLWVEMAFDGLRFCGVLPGLREKNAKTLEYYVQAVDDAYQSARTSTYQMQVQPEAVCEFPPLAKAGDGASGIVVYATHKKQGRKLHAAFDGRGVSFVPLAALR